MAHFAFLFLSEVFMFIVNVLFVLVALMGLFSFFAATKDSPRTDFYRKIDPIHYFWGRRAAKVFGLPIFIFGLAVPFPLTSFFLDGIVGTFFLAAGYGYLCWMESLVKKDEISTEK
jgi:hypothetical protein